MSKSAPMQERPRPGNWPAKPDEVSVEEIDPIRFPAVGIDLDLSEMPGR
ncbi:MAG: hypothetical protein IPO15_24400 [Anaerolineae bacterium]|nr:hypothetical protein [Anaerolineae bacterium]